MPEAGQQPDDEDVTDMLERADPVAAQRDVHIVPEEGAEGNMPPAPELRDTFGDIGIVEILEKAETENAAHADGHVGIAAEIEIDLEGVGNCHEPAAPEGHIARGHQLIGDDAAGVGQQHLLGKADEKSQEAFVHILGPDLTALQCRFNVGVIDDGAGNQLGEETHIHQKPSVTALHRHLAAVHIHRIGQHLKGVEGDADGQHGLQKGVFPAQKTGNHIAEEAEIFKVKQKAEAQGNAGDHADRAVQGTSGAVNQQTAEVVDGYRQQHDEDPFGFSPRVEKQRKCQQHTVSDLWMLDRKVKHQNQWQKQGGKDHG